MAKKKTEEVVLENSIGGTPENPPIPAESTPQQMVPLADVKKLIDEAISKSRETKPLQPKKVTEHTAHVWRLDGKWVVDFVDKNVDEYVKDKIHAYIKYNPITREKETWIELKFHDGSTKDIALPSYVKNRVPVYCTILKRTKIDKSYSIGEVEKKKEVNDKLVGTGVMVSQSVERYEEMFELKTPDGEILTLPDYVIA